MISVTPQGSGFFIFFQTVKEHYSWVDRPDYSKKRREENEIIVLLHSMYESGQF